MTAVVAAVPTGIVDVDVDKLDDDVDNELFAYTYDCHTHEMS